MSIAEQLTKLSTDITNAYNSIQTKGGTIPTNKNTENLASAIDSITSGGEPGGGGEVPEGGNIVMVQAGDNFSVGDTFAGVKRDGGNPKVVSVALGIKPALMSADGNVALLSQKLSATSTTLDVYINVDGGWSIAKVDLPDMTGATSRDTDYASINEDGSQIAWSLSTFLLAIDVDVKNVSATAVRIEPFEVNVSGLTYSTNNYKVLEFNGFDNVCLVGNYIFFTGGVKYQYSETTTKNATAGAFGRFGTSITNEYFWGMGAVYSSYYKPDSHSEVLTNDEGNKVIFFSAYSSGGVRRFELSLGKVIKDNANGTTASYITRNGEYALSGKTIYKINQETGTLSTLSTITSSNSVSAIDENIKYWLGSDYKIYMMGDLAGLNPISTDKNAPIKGTYFDLDNGLFFHSRNSYERCTALVNEEGEYIITHASLVPSGGDIYGVTTEAMAMGEVKEAMKLFSKASGESIIPTFVEYIQSSGTQYIKTGILPNQSTKIEMEIAFTSASGNEALWCARTGGSSNTFTCFKIANKFRTDYYNTQNTISAVTIVAGQKYKVCQDGNLFYIDDVLQKTCTQATFTPAYNMILFASHTGGEATSLNNYGKYKLYSCKIYNNDELVRDFKPALYLNEYGLYDEVSKEFYSNAGSGSFTGG